MNTRLVVLYAKSGIGKSSLINAGLLPRLRQKNFFPVKVRVDKSEINPLKSIYDTVERVARERNVNYDKKCNKQTLWHYFKIQEFLHSEDILLIPVLIFDQFEEFFTHHSEDTRQRFISQFAAIIRGRPPENWNSLLKPGEEITDSEKAPNIKIIISIREDYLGELEELAIEIPAILKNRMRLLPLNKDKAKDAIIRPAQCTLKESTMPAFEYTPEAVNMLLDFLCTQKKGGKKIRTDEIEPFQLQLLCQHIEGVVRNKQNQGQKDVVVIPDDLGGEHLMKRIIGKFYVEQLNKPDIKWIKGKVRKLCEKGLISDRDNRLSLAGEIIIKDYGIDEKILLKLVNSRLLRKEPHLDDFYYELSHDTLIEPIRDLQKKRIKPLKIIFSILIPCALFCICLGFIFLFSELNVYNMLGYADKQIEQRKFDEATEYHEKVLKLNPDLTKKIADNNIKIALILRTQNKIDEALLYYQKAFELNPDLFILVADGYKSIAWEFLYKARFKDGKKYLSESKKIEETGIIKAAYDIFRKKIEKNPLDASAYFHMGNVYRDFKKYKESIEYYKIAVKYKENYHEAYVQLSFAYGELKKNEEARKNRDLAQKYKDLAQKYEEKAQIIIKNTPFELKPLDESREKSNNKD